MSMSPKSNETLTNEKAQVNEPSGFEHSMMEEEMRN